MVEVDGDDALRLDVSGVAHLFGGEEGLVATISAPVRGASALTARVAIAPTRRSGLGAGAIHALHLRGGATAKAGAARPSSALRLEPDTVRTLERLGLKTIGALIDMPRLALARRFRGGEDVVDALDRLLGRKPEPLTAAPVDPPPRATLRLEEPATHPEAASQALERLIPGLVRAARAAASRRAAAVADRLSGRRQRRRGAVATTIPSREPKHLQRLLADKAAALDPEFGFDAFALTADGPRSWTRRRTAWSRSRRANATLARLVDRLTVKLGPGAGAAAAGRGKPFARAGERMGCGNYSPPLQGRGEGWGAAEAARCRLRSFRAGIEPVRPPPNPFPLPCKGGEKRPNACSTVPKRSTSSTRPQKACRGA